MLLYVIYFNSNRRVYSKNPFVGYFSIHTPNTVKRQTWSPNYIKQHGGNLSVLFVCHQLMFVFPFRTFFSPTAEKSSWHSRKNKHDQASVNRETVYLLYNIILVTFVYKLLDFSSIFLQNDRCSSDCIHRKLKRDNMHPDMNSIKRSNWI